MGKQPTKPALDVELVNVKTGEKVSYRRDHAEAILEHERKLGIISWGIPKSSNLIFENGKLVERSSDKPDQGAGTSSGAQASDK